MSRKAELQKGIDGPGSIQMDLEPVTAHVVAQYHNAGTGSSFAVHGGARMTAGYSVGGLRNVPETVVDSESISPDDWQGHRDKVRASVPDLDAVAGTWKEDGKTVMDASNVVLDRDRAKALQKSRGERAVYNLKAQKDEDLS